MIITERNADPEEFFFAPIYYLTGDLETAKFYSNLASATAKFGTFLEHKIKELIKLPIIEYSEINSCTQKSILKKQNIDGVEPDFVLINPTLKIIEVFEVKSNMFNMDSKQCKTENYTGQKMKIHFIENFQNFNTEVYLVNFFGFTPTKRGKHVLPLTDNFIHITGKDFSQKIEISYELVLNSLKNDRIVNQKFIDNYKNKPTIMNEVF